jgi:predicted RNA-binding protein with TRAM domain
MYGDRGYGGRGGGGFNDRQMTPPVREGEEIDVTIEAVGEKGDGIARQKGFVLFVPSTQAGQRVRIKITKVLAKVGFAQVLGPAQTAADAPQEQRQKPKEPEFDANEEMDSEDFGDDSGDSDAEEKEE